MAESNGERCEIKAAVLEYERRLPEPEEGERNLRRQHAKRDIEALTRQGYGEIRDGYFYFSNLQKNAS